MVMKQSTAEDNDGFKAIQSGSRAIIKVVSRQSRLRVTKVSEQSGQRTRIVLGQSSVASGQSKQGIRMVSKQSAQQRTGG